MENLSFWIIAVALALGVALLLILGQRRAPGGALAEGGEDLKVYRDQLAEVDRDLARGTLAEAEAQRLKTEISRRLLDADRALRSAAPAPAAGGGGVLPAVLVLLAVGGALLLYRQTGVPGYPDLPLAQRLADLDAAMAARPGQAEELARLGTAPDPASLAPIQAELAAATDPEALLAAFQARFAAGEMRAAVLTMERRIALLGDAAASGDFSGLAIALVTEVQGYVSPEAEGALREALKRDLGNEVARYLVGEMFLQAGRFDQTFRFWRPLVETGDPAAPWTAAIRDRIETVAELAGVPYTLPPARAAAGAAPGGPSAEDLAAAAEMTPEERQAMIEGMVAQLADRLATEGGPAEDWARLITSLAALGRLDEAREIYAEAQQVFEGRSVEMAGLREAAVLAGVAE